MEIFIRFRNLLGGAFIVKASLEYRKQDESLSPILGTWLDAMERLKSECQAKICQHDETQLPEQMDKIFEELETDLLQLIRERDAVEIDTGIHDECATVLAGRLGSLFDKEWEFYRKEGVLEPGMWLSMPRE